MMQPATIPQEQGTETGGAQNMGSLPVALMSY
jgi:hypothetical protein